MFEWAIDTNFVTIKQFSIYASALFVFLFFYWLAPRNWQRGLVAFASTFVVYLVEPISCFILLLLVPLLFFLQSRYLDNYRDFAFLFSILLLVMAFTVYKIYLVRTANPYVIIGLSYYTLKLLHYVVEAQKTFSRCTFGQFYTYMFFFPTIVIGPIHRFDDFIRSERRRRWDTQKFAQGLDRILYGLVKVIVLGNEVVGRWLPYSIDMFCPEGSFSRFYLECLQHAFSMYFQFAGYSDIAIGISLLLGYQICENFRNPFLKENIVEFWKAWHISLSDWCRQYIFLPVSAITRKPKFALVVSMLGIGLWHEFSLNYILWGLYHGIGIVIYYQFQKIKGKIPTPTLSPRGERIKALGAKSLAIFINFNFVVLSFFWLAYV